MRNDAMRGAVALAAIAAITAIYTSWLHVSNATTVALTFLLVVLVTAATTRLRVAVVASIAAMLCFNFFFLPPVGTFTIADPQNWVALFVFLAVSLVASNLSATARERAAEATARRDELGRLFDLSRDVLLVTGGSEAFVVLARYIARRFDIDYVALCLPEGEGWNIAEGGSISLSLNRAELTAAFANIENTLEFDARERTYAGHRVTAAGSYAVRLVPLRLGTRPIGLFAAAGAPAEPGTLDAIAGVASIAIERVQFLEERKSAEVARKSEEMKSALLASLGHDLRTPLTAIRVAATNLQASWLSEPERREQSDVVLTEVARLTRLFQNILDMARIDAGAVESSLQWVHPQEIAEAARDQVEHSLRNHPVQIAANADGLVRLDPRLTAAALAHLLENAAQYSTSGLPIDITASVAGSDLLVHVRDRGAGISPADMPQLFHRFYRGGQSAQHASGTGMGLSIARGLLAAEGGRVWAENAPDGGAIFTIAVPVERKPEGDAE
jgi:two-component system, OmpR family, sensor histidine kinase KdpD